MKTIFIVMISANVTLVAVPEYVRKAVKEFGGFSLDPYSPATVVTALKKVQVSKKEEIV